MENRRRVQLDLGDRDWRCNDAAAPDRLDRYRNAGTATGEFLHMLVSGLRPRRILEIGTSNGYSTIWLADAAESIGEVGRAYERVANPLAGPLTPSNIALYRVNMPRVRHPKKEIAAALAELEDAGWRVESTPSGHRWGVARCGEASRAGCQVSIWSTPGNHARALRRALAQCAHTQSQSEE